MLSPLKTPQPVSRVARSHPSPILSAGLPLGTAADAFGQGDGRAFTLGWAEAAAVGGVVVSPPGGALVGALSDLRLYLNQPGSDSGGLISQLYHAGVSSAGATKQNDITERGAVVCVGGEDAPSCAL